MPATKAKQALVVLAGGAEEMEAVIPVDVLRRAGVQVTLAGLAGEGPVVCSRGVRLLPDRSLASALGEGRVYDLVLLPGGARGAEALARSAEVKELLLAQDRAGRLVAAICAGPRALQAAGVIRERAFTSHPAVREELAPAGDYREERVVRAENLVTSRGPGTALAFALALVEALLGREMAERVAGPMLVEDW